MLYPSSSDDLYSDQKYNNRCDDRQGILGSILYFIKPIETKPQVQYIGALSLCGMKELHSCYFFFII